MTKKLSPNESPINYKIAGAGDKAFVLLHNAGGNTHFLENQFHHLQSQGRVLSFDFRGHGESEKPYQNYSVETYAQDILDLCHDLNISKASFIGLNFGAAVAIELATLSPPLVSSLVFIDPPIIMEPWVQKLVQDHIDELKDSSYTNFAENLVQSILPNASPKIKKIAIDAFNKTSRQALVSTYENLVKWDHACLEKLRACHMPILNIQTAHPFCPEEKLRHACPQLISVKVQSAGPWATLEVPEEVNVMIDQFLLMN